MAAVNLVYFSTVLLLIGLPATLLPIFYDEAQIVIEDLLNLSDQTAPNTFDAHSFFWSDLPSGRMGAEHFPGPKCGFIAAA